MRIRMDDWTMLSPTVGLVGVHAQRYCGIEWVGSDGVAKGKRGLKSEQEEGALSNLANHRPCQRWMVQKANHGGIVLIF